MNHNRYYICGTGKRYCFFIRSTDDFLLFFQVLSRKADICGRKYADEAHNENREAEKNKRGVFFRAASQMRSKHRR